MLYPLSYGGGSCASRGRWYSSRGAHRPRSHGMAERCRILHLHAGGPRRRDRTFGGAPSAALGHGRREGPPPCRRHRPAGAGRSNSARRSSSTTRTISVGPVVRRSWRGATGSPTPPRRSSAAPWPALPTRRECSSTWRPAASSTWRWRPASRPSVSSSTATTSRSRSWRRRWSSASAGSSSTRSTRSLASAASWSGPQQDATGPGFSYA